MYRQSAGPHGQIGRGVLQRAVLGTGIGPGSARTPQRLLSTPAAQEIARTGRHAQMWPVRLDISGRV